MRSARSVERAPITHAAILLMLASKKSVPMCTLSHASARTTSAARALTSSVRVITWSLSQRTPRLTCRKRPFAKGRRAEILSTMDSVGW